MPYMCCIPSCKGNYKTGPKVQVFGFPKDEEQKRKWLCSIKRQDFTPSKTSKVLYIYLQIITNVCVIL